MMESLEALEETLAQTRDEDAANPMDEFHRLDRYIQMDRLIKQR